MTFLQKSSQDLTRNVALMLSLGEDAILLGHKFLDNARPKLAENLESTSIANSPNVWHASNRVFNVHPQLFRFYNIECKNYILGSSRRVYGTWLWGFPE